MKRKTCNDLMMRPSSAKARARVVGLSFTCRVRMTPAALRCPNFNEPARRIRSGQFSRINSRLMEPVVSALNSP